MMRNGKLLWGAQSILEKNTLKTNMIVTDINPVKIPTNSRRTQLRLQKFHFLPSLSARIEVSVFQEELSKIPNLFML